MIRWWVLRINPEPWAIGPVGYARRNGKMSAYVGQNQQLNSYKEAIREELGEQEMQEGQHVLYLYFWRNRAEYKTSQSRVHRKHEADLTNLQKATEDALQGVLFSNDRDVRQVQSVLMEQGPDVEPGIIIGLAPYLEPMLPEEAVKLMLESNIVPSVVNHDWKIDEEVPF